ncbi:MAG TPA: tetratricopeptide repeat protein [Pelomicrobium sp.]|nr:tetratricopeptide repeat protein [Pelomicrobium sp.]
MLRFTLLLTTIVLAACAQVPAAQPRTVATTTASAQENAKAGETKAAPAAGEEALPNVELTRQLFYQFLMAEIAAQRGQTDAASATYLDLAKKTRDPRVAQRATEVAVFARRAPEALEAAQLWLELEPSADRARQTVAALLVNSGRLDEAKPHLRQLLVDEGDNIGQGFLQLNSLLARHGDKQKVLALTRELAAPYPDLAEAHFAVAQAAANAGDDAAALAELKRARELKPDWELAVLLEGQVLRRSSTDKALAAYKAFLDEYPKSREVRLAYARLLVGEKRYADARAQFEQLMADNPRSAEVTVAVAMLAMQLKDYDAAERHFRTALDQGYRDKDAVRMFLGQMEEERKRYDQAAGWYRSVTGGDQKLQAEVRYAGVLAKQGKLDEARQYLSGIATANPKQEVQVILAEAQLLREAGLNQEAYDLLDRELKKRPADPDLLYDHAMAAERLDRMDVLEANLRELMRIKPDHAHAYNALGYSLADRGLRLDEAKALIEKALEISPDDPFILDSMGWVKYRMGDVPGALEYLRRAYSLRPDPEIAAHLGEVLWVTGQRDEAKKVWNTALSDHPDNKVLVEAVRKFTP